jgi:hypothetical protein
MCDTCETKGDVLEIKTGYAYQRITLCIPHFRIVNALVATAINEFIDAHGRYPEVKP